MKITKKTKDNLITYGIVVAAYLILYNGDFNINRKSFKSHEGTFGSYDILCGYCGCA